jgi:Peptidase A4 family
MSTPRIRFALIAVVSLLAVVSVLLPASGAGAAAKISSNWAGYVVTPKSSATHFKRVSASWRVPQGNCSSASSGLSAQWVGIGGYPHSARALEQVGTEYDCSANGTAKYSAWFELVPRPARTLKMTVRPGDAISAAVTVHGRRVTIYLRNRSQHKTFKRHFTMKKPDTRSAEWIVEAPSRCTRAHGCKQVALSNFGTVSFRRASVMTSRGTHGAISGRRWAHTKVALSQGGAHPVDRLAAPRGAAPSLLSAAGKTFSVSFTAQAAATRLPAAA